MKKKVIAIFLVSAMLLAMMPMMSVGAEAASAVLSLEQLRQKFPHGKYWNHAGNPGSSNAVNNQDGYTATPCSRHGTVGTNAQTCNGFAPNGTQVSWQCMGYAEKLGYDATGYNPRNNANGWHTYTNKSALDNLKAGDIVRYKNNGHSIYVIAVDGDTVTYTDCNSDGHCVIRWDATISKSTLRATFTYVRSAPSEPKPAACDCSTQYAGDYICTTSDSNLMIRSGHGTSYAAVGTIPPGETVYVSKASGTSNGDWAHVTYNGMTGYASMEYLQKQETDHAEMPTIQWWLSDSEYGEEVSEPKVGNRYYLCYRLYDGVTGRDWDEVSPNSYTVKLAIYNPDGSLNHEDTQTDDTGWISIFYSVPGTYTREVIVDGDFAFTGSRDYYVAENPKQIHATEDAVNLLLGNTESITIYVWTTGYHANSTYLNCSRSNDNVGCAWGQWTADHVLPLTITANAAGTTTITLSVHDGDTLEVLDAMTVTVTVSANSYTVSYNANGGDGAPSGQTKSHGTALTLSSAIPSRFGYNFIGWAASASAASAAYHPGDTYTIDANITLYAVWSAAETISTTTEAVKNPASGYGRVGYYYKLTSSISTSYSMRIFDISEEGGVSITLYDANGNKLQSVNGEDHALASEYDCALDYKLVAGKTYYIYLEFTDTDQDGVHLVVSRGYLLTYSANGGTQAPASEYYYYGTGAHRISRELPAREGYTFVSWNTKADGSGNTYAPGGYLEEGWTSVTLYAVWQKACPESHTYILVVTDPTCTEQGYTTHTCVNCSRSYVDSYVDAIGHAMGQWYVYTPSTGNEKGEARCDCANCDYYESKELPLRGDVNADDRVDTTDAKLIMQFDLMMIAETALELSAADVNGDGKVDTTDAKLIMQYDLGIIAEFPESGKNDSNSVAMPPVTAVELPAPAKKRIQ